MKEFFVYTVLRLALFVGAAALVYGVWAAVADEVPVLWVVVIAFLVSGFASYVLLRPQREAFARRTEQRVQRMRGGEDRDRPPAG